MTTGQGVRGTAARFVAMAGLCGLLSLGLGLQAAFAQVNTRVLLSSGAGVPDHPGFTFGPFHDLAMNGRQQIVFRTELRSPRVDLQAIVRSVGVTFSVVAFGGLVSPVPQEVYDAFSAPSINNSGSVAFTATLKGRGVEGEATAAIIEVKDGRSELVVANGSAAGKDEGTLFEEFSAPVIGSAGEVLFGARTKGQNPGSGLFLWSTQGIHQVPLPENFHVGPQDLLQPLFSSHNEAVFVRRDAATSVAGEQFFRAVAIQNFQQINPSPNPAETIQILPARPGQKPVQLLLVLLDDGRAQTVVLKGDPSQPVTAKRSPGVDTQGAVAFTAVQGQTSGPGSGNVIFAAVPAGHEDDFGIFCFCDGQVVRLTSQEDFSLLVHNLNGKPIVSLAGDAQHIVAFIAPVGTQPDANAIFVSYIP
jgi:hypothetical protein